MTRPHLHVDPPDEDPGRDRYRAIEDTFEQTVAARDRLFLPESAYLHLPWPDLDDLVGGVPPGDVWFVAGFSGNGKTTWLMNLVHEYLEAGRTVYYLGLESRPAVLRTHLACLRLGYYAGDVLSGAEAQKPGWTEKRQELVAEFERQRALGQRDRFVVNGVTHVNDVALRDAAHDAAMTRADVLVIDHVDHLRHSTGRSQIEESVRVVHLILDLAQRNGLRMLVATQCNNEGARGDRLGQYQPPQVHHVYMGSSKRMVATGMLGLYRPLRQNLTKEELTEVRSGKLEAHKLLEPNMMGVSVMKHRYYGSREGHKALLAFDQGRLKGLNERDHYTTADRGRFV